MEATLAAGADALTSAALAVPTSALDVDEPVVTADGALPSAFSEPRSASLAQAVARALSASQSRNVGLKLLMFAVAGRSMARQPGEPKLPANAKIG